MMRTPITAGAAGALLLLGLAATQWPISGSLGPAPASTGTMEGARELARRLNAESDASVARVALLRATEFARQRNAEIEASVARVTMLRTAELIRRRGAEIEAAVEARRATDLAPALADANASSAR